MTTVIERTGVPVPRPGRFAALVVVASPRAARGRGVHPARPRCPARARGLDRRRGPRPGRRRRRRPLHRRGRAARRLGHRPRARAARRRLAARHGADDQRRPVQRPRRHQRRRPLLPRLDRDRRPRRCAPATARGEGVDSLSAREIQVLQLVADGKSNKDIGEALGLSALTVKSHLGPDRPQARHRRPRRDGRDRDARGRRHLSAAAWAAAHRDRRAGDQPGQGAVWPTVSRCRRPAAADGRHGGDRDRREPGAAERRADVARAPPASCARSTRRATACPRSSTPSRPSPTSSPRCAAGTGPVAVDAERASGLPLRPAGLPRPAAPRGRRAPG